jgi:plasmid stabilization system protein ParE
LAIERSAEAAQRIAEENPTAAERWVRGLFDAVKVLARFPHRGREVPETHREEIRELIYRNHRVVYRVSARTVEVLTVRHLRRQWDPAEVRDRE